jgi:hypothetical protein
MGNEKIRGAESQDLPMLLPILGGFKPFVGPPTQQAAGVAYWLKH